MFYFVGGEQNLVEERNSTQQRNRRQLGAIILIKGVLCCGTFAHASLFHFGAEAEGGKLLRFF